MTLSIWIPALVLLGLVDLGPDVCLRRSAVTRCNRSRHDLFAAFVTLLLFIYLLVALLRPEWF